MSKITAIEKEKTRARIIEIGMKMFLEKGYEQVSIRAIAKEANVGASTFYGYFENKLEFFVQVFMKDFNYTTNIDKYIETSFDKDLKLDAICELLGNNFSKQLKEALKIGKSNLKQIYKLVLSEEILKFIHPESTNLANREITVKIFEKSKEQGQFLVDFDIKETLHLIRFISIQNVGIYLNSDVLTIDQMTENFKKQIHILLLGKIAE